MKNYLLNILILAIGLGLAACNNYKFSPSEDTANTALQVPETPDSPDIIPPLPTPPTPVEPPPVVVDPIPVDPIPVTPPVVPPTPPEPPPVVITPPEPPPVVITPPEPPAPPLPPPNQNIAESFEIPIEKPQADILILLDTSGSMDRDLEKFSQKFPSLISKWNNIDWQIGITNVSVNKWDSWAMMGYLMHLEGNPGASSTILKKTTPFAQQIFESNIGRSKEEHCQDGPPWCMTAKPEPMKTILSVLEKKSEKSNENFFRKGSYLVPIIISDSDEKESNLQDPTITQPEFVMEQVKNILGKNLIRTVGFGVVVKPGDETCLKEENNLFKGGKGAKYATVADHFAKISGGFTSSICEKDYAASLEKISDHLRQIIESFPLKNNPLPGTLKVEFIPEQKNITWKQEGQKIILSETPKPGTKVVISYEIAG